MDFGVLRAPTCFPVSFPFSFCYKFNDFFILLWIDFNLLGEINSCSCITWVGVCSPVVARMAAWATAARLATPWQQPQDFGDDFVDRIVNEFVDEFSNEVVDEFVGEVVDAFYLEFYFRNFEWLHLPFEQCSDCHETLLKSVIDYSRHFDFQKPPILFRTTSGVGIEELWRNGPQNQLRCWILFEIRLLCLRYTYSENCMTKTNEQKLHFEKVLTHK